MFIVSVGAFFKNGLSGGWIFIVVVIATVVNSDDDAISLQPHSQTP